MPWKEVSVRGYDEQHEQTQHDDDTNNDEGRDKEWDPPTNTIHCIRIVVDNQTLANIINGDAVLTDPTLQPAVSNIINRLHNWADRGWATPNTRLTLYQLALPRIQQNSR